MTSDTIRTNSGVVPVTLSVTPMQKPKQKLDVQEVDVKR